MSKFSGLLKSATMELRILGSGTSFGIPKIGCNCSTCTSDDVRDKRNRTSALITFENGKNVLIDCGPEFRVNAIRAKIKHIDYVIITHEHSDHINGIPDLIPLAKNYPIHIFLSSEAHEKFKEAFEKMLTKDLIFHPISGPFEINGVIFTPIPVMHGIMNIFGYRFGNSAYITDCSKISDESVLLAKGVDTLVINALRIQRHSTHMSFQESLDVIKQIKPKRAFWIHMTHDHNHEDMIKFIQDSQSSDSELADIEIAPAVDELLLKL